jgi:hypothetical protein
MATSPLPGRLTPFPESVQAGQAPANAAAWAALTSMRFIAESADPSGLVQSVVPDQRSQLYILDDEPVILGIKGSVEFPFAAYLHGSGTSPADGAAVSAWPLGTFMGHCFGAVHLGTTDALVATGAHAADEVELTDTVPIGAGIGFVDPDTGLEHIRHVTATAAGSVGVIHTLHRELPWIPDDGELAIGKTTISIDEDVLEDSGVALSRTYSWLYESGRQNSSSRETWEMRGCVSFITGITLGRNELPRIQVMTLVASFDTPETAPVPTWSTLPVGSAPRVIGPNTSVFLQAVGTTTDQTFQVADFNITPGVTREAQPALTEDTAGMPGIGRYGLIPGACTISTLFAPTADARLTEFANRTELHLQFERQAPAGAWSIYFPRVTHSTEPAKGAAGPIQGYQQTFQAHQVSAGATDLARSRILIAL